MRQPDEDVSQLSDVPLLLRVVISRLVHSGSLQKERELNGRQEDDPPSFSFTSIEGGE